MNEFSRRDRTLLMISGAVALLCFAIAFPLILDAGFGAEDFLIAPRAEVPWGEAVAGYFAASDPEAIHYYRPATRAIQRTLQVFSGTSGPILHAWNLALHALSTWLLYRLARSLGATRTVGSLVAIVFLIHPAHDEPIIWLSGISGLTETACHLGALVVFDAFLKRGESVSGIWSGFAIVLLFIAGVLFKESGSSMALTLPLLWWYRGHKWRDFWPVGAICLTALGMAVWRNAIGVDSSLALDNLSWHPLTWARNLIFYTVQFLAPVRSLFRVIGFDHFYRVRDMLPSTPGTWVYIVGITLAGIAGLAFIVRIWRSIPGAVKCCATAAVASIAPLLISRYTGMRLMYLFSGLLAVALVLMVSRHSTRRWVVPVFTVWLIVMSVSFMERAEAWRQSGDLAGRIFEEALVIVNSVPAESTVVFRGIPGRHLGGFVFPVTFSEAIMKRTGPLVKVINYEDPHEEISEIPVSAVWFKWNGASFNPISANQP